MHRLWGGEHRALEDDRKVARLCSYVKLHLAEFYPGFGDQATDLVNRVWLRMGVLACHIHHHVRHADQSF